MPGAYLQSWKEGPPIGEPFLVHSKTGCQKGSDSQIASLTDSFTMFSMSYISEVSSKVL